MKRIRHFYILFALFVLGGCNFPSIFSSENQEEKTNLDAAQPMLLQVEITGGFAGVQQHLTVEVNGKAGYIDSFLPGAQWIDELSVEEVQALTDLFRNNGFFELGESQYVDTRVADAFQYAITFYESDVVRTVKTDNFGAPDNLKRIVEGLIQLIDRLTGTGLALELQLSQAEIVVGEPVDLTLLVTNTADRALTLHFSSGQIFDFFAKSEQQSGSAVSVRRDVFWNWAHNKAFTQALQEITLAPGESRAYQVAWDGVGNDGSARLGEVFIGADLVSVPGGSPACKALLIKAAN